MTARIGYRVCKTIPYDDPAKQMHWMLVRSGTVISDEEDGHALGVLPEVDVAQFKSDNEAELFMAWMADHKL